MTHIDDWLDDPAINEPIAKTFLEHCRRPAIEKDYKWLADNPLFCTYHSERFRCIGASRMGDVWLARDFTVTHGYDLRIDVAECSNWSTTADIPQ